MAAVIKMANATLMCQAFSKNVNEWIRLKSVKRYQERLKTKYGKIPYLISTKGGVNGGTWIHERLILKLAQWLDVDFEIWCDSLAASLRPKVEYENK